MSESPKTAEERRRAGAPRLRESPRVPLRVHQRRVAQADAERLGGGPDLAAIRIPAGEVFVMGDFRGNSRDSRYFGFVREDAIYAKAQRVYYRSGEGFIWKAL